jgi:hypothetical protein
MIYQTVWDGVTRVLRHPTIIAREEERRWEDGSCARDLAAVEHMLLNYYLALSLLAAEELDPVR